MREKMRERKSETNRKDVDSLSICTNIEVRVIMRVVSFVKKKGKRQVN